MTFRIKRNRNRIRIGYMKRIYYETNIDFSPWDHPRFTVFMGPLVLEIK